MTESLFFFFYWTSSRVVNWYKLRSIFHCCALFKRISDRHTTRYDKRLFGEVYRLLFFQQTEKRLFQCSRHERRNQTAANSWLLKWSRDGAIFFSTFLSCSRHSHTKLFVLHNVGERWNLPTVMKNFWLRQSGIMMEICRESMTESNRWDVLWVINRIWLMWAVDRTRMCEDSVIRVLNLRKLSWPTSFYCEPQRAFVEIFVLDFASLFKENLENLQLQE